MKKPRPQDFDPGYKEKKPFKPEEVDLSGVVAIKPKREANKRPKMKRSQQATVIP